MREGFEELLDKDECDSNGTSPTISKNLFREGTTVEGNGFYRENGFFIFRQMDYKFPWTMYYVLVCIICGGIICAVDSIPFIDGLFMAASAMTGAGLSTVGMYQLSTVTFQIMGVLMMIGCAPFMIMVVIAFRRQGFARVTSKVQKLRDEKKLPLRTHLSVEEKEVIDDCFLVDEALGVLGYITLVYYVGLIFLGTGIVYLALHSRPLQVELAERNISFLDNATFLTISSLANAGLTLTSDNLIGMCDNPYVYVFLTFLILAGNTALPIFLRVFIAALLHVETQFIGRCLPNYEPVPQQRPQSKHANASTDDVGEHRRSISVSTPAAYQETARARYRRVLQFILDHPRRLTPYLFSHLQTKVLVILNAVLICTQYVFFLGSTMNRHSALQERSRASLAGIGYFQTLSTRSAGFAMMDLRHLNQGLIFIYAVMMYMSAFPFVATLEKAENQSDSVPHVPTPVFHTPVEYLSTTIHSQLMNQKDSLRYRSSTKSIDNPLHPLPTTQTPTSHKSIRYPTGSAAAKNVDEYTMDKKHVKASNVNKKLMSHFLFRHSFFLLLAILICAYSEDEILSNPNVDVNLWYIMFEIISGYGNVGLSLGVPGQVYSLSGAMTVTGKLVIVLVMWLGKHRGLPSAKDEVVDFAWERYLSACRYDRCAAATTAVSTAEDDHDTAARSQYESHLDDSL